MFTKSSFRQNAFKIFSTSIIFIGVDTYIYVPAYIPIAFTTTQSQAGSHGIFYHCLLRRYLQFNLYVCDHWAKIDKIICFSYMLGLLPTVQTPGFSVFKKYRGKLSVLIQCPCILTKWWGWIHIWQCLEVTNNGVKKIFFWKKLEKIKAPLVR
jgi:hypothetical protein